MLLDIEMMISDGNFKDLSKSTFKCFPICFFTPNLNRVSQPSTNQKRHFLQEIGIVGLRDDPPFTAEDYEAFPWHDARQQ